MSGLVKKSHFFLVLGALSLTLLFTLIAFLPSQAESSGSSLLMFFVHELNFIRSYLIIFILFFLFLIFIFLRTSHFEKKISFTRRIIVSMVNVSIVSLLGFFLSYVLLFAVGLIQLNATALLINMNPKLIGLEEDINEIAKNLDTRRVPPKIITAESHEKILPSIAIASAGPDSFYSNYILTTMPAFTTVSFKSLDSSMFMLDNTLIITRINFQDMEEVTPVITYAFLKNFFWRKPIKKYPEVRVVSREEYQEYREEDISRRMVEIEERIVEMEDNVSTASAVVVNLEQQVNSLEGFLSESPRQRDDEYRRCIVDSSLSSDSCRSLRREWDERISNNKVRLQEFEERLIEERLKLEDYQYYVNFFATQKEIATLQTEDVIHEFAFYNPAVDDTIWIALNTEGTYNIADYLVTLVHEYLHYASFKSKEEAFASRFFEEALTEYFARRIVEKNLGTQTNLGYPIHVKIIEEMVKKILEAELADIYFDKNEKELERVIDRVYGRGFYKENLLVFENIHFAPNSKRALELANSIMEKIGGDKLTEEDIVSTRCC